MFDLDDVRRAALQKLAEVRSTLEPHQQRVVDRIQEPDQPGLVVAHGTGTGKCARGDTVVWTNRGLLPIEALFAVEEIPACGDAVHPANGLRIASWVGGKLEWSPVRARYVQLLPGIETTVVVETHRGHAVDVTRAHPLLVVRSGMPTWVRAGDVVVGDAIAMAGALPDAAFSSDLPADLWHVLTWQTAEGWENPKKAQLIISQKDPAILYELQHRLRRAVPGTATGHVRFLPKGVHELQIHSTEYRSILERAGHRWGDKSATRRMPDAWTLLPSALLLDLLRGFFDAEGHAGKSNLEITLASRELCLQVQYAWLRFGVRTSLHGRMNCATNGSQIKRPYWRLSFSGEDAHRCAELLGPASSKWEALRLFAGRTSNPNYGVPAAHVLTRFAELGVLKAFGQAHSTRDSVSDRVARELVSTVRRMCSRDDMDRRKARYASMGGTSGKFARRTVAVIEAHRDELLQLADALETTANCGLRFERVTSVRSGDAGGLVYDLEVEAPTYDTKNYVGGPGGFILHNTLSSIAAIDALGLPADAVVPAALQENYSKELDKHLEPGSARPDVHSLAAVGRTGGARALADATPSHAGGTLVVDEAHRLRNPNSIGYGQMRELGARAAKRLYLSASPVYNHPVDIAPLVNLAANEHVLPETQAGFAHDYLHTKKVEPGFFAGLAGVHAGEVDELDPRKSGDLAAKLRKWVDFHQNPTDNGDFPQRHDETIDVPVSDEQRKVYDTLMGDAPFWVRYKVRRGLPPSKQEAADLNAFSSGARQSLLSPHVFARDMDLTTNATKQRAAVERLQRGIAENPHHKAVVYSPYLGAGLDPYAKLLEERGIPYGRFTGEVPKEVRDQAVRDYNENKLRALLVSDAGSEGLDLKGTRAIQILAPAWNQERLNQIIGRGIRYKSHADLPEAERHVNVENYRSVLPQSTLARLFRMKPDTSVDQYMDQVTANKERLNAQLRDVMARGGIGTAEDEQRAAELNREEAHRAAMDAWTRSQAGQR